MMATKARVLFFDIETMAILGWTFGPLYEAKILHVEHDTHLLSIAWKWVGEKRTYVKGLPDFPLYRKDPHNDLELAKLIHRLLDEADIVIGHNSTSFDVKIVNSRIMHHHLTPPAPYRQIDTKRIAKKYGRFTSNKLDDLGKELQLGQKLDTGGFDLWLKCDSGDMAAWDKMLEYNKQDVILDEELYLELRPWIENHPAMNLLLNKMEACPKCGEGPLHSKGKQVSKTNVYQRYQCQNCGGYSRLRIPEKSLEKVKFTN